MNSNKTKGLSTRTKIWMGVGAYILSTGLCDVANASAPQSQSHSSQEMASEISTSGNAITPSEMWQASTQGSESGKTDDEGKDKKGDEGDEGGEGGEGGEG